MRTFLSLTVDEDGHWIAICDRCSLEIRTKQPHESMGISLLANFMDELHAHQATHPVDTKASVVDDEQDIGGDDDVEALAGALTDETGW